MPLKDTELLLEGNKQNFFLSVSIQHIYAFDQADQPLLSDCDEATANFHCSSGLKNLTIAFCTGLTDESLRAVGENCQELEMLDMQGCELVTSKGVKAIAEDC